MKKILLIVLILTFTGCSNSSKELNNTPPTIQDDITLTETSNVVPDNILSNDTSTVI